MNKRALSAVIVFGGFLGAILAFVDLTYSVVVIGVTLALVGLVGIEVDDG